MCPSADACRRRRQALCPGGGAVADPADSPVCIRRDAALGGCQDVYKREYEIAAHGSVRGSVRYRV